jgi:hypothetical protein
MKKNKVAAETGNFQIVYLCTDIARVSSETLKYTGGHTFTLTK